MQEYLKGSTYKGGVMDMFLRESNPKDLREDQRKKRMEGWSERPLDGEFPSNTKEMET